jgi:hopene-associated glycosyltransferase HpnB
MSVLLIVALLAFMAWIALLTFRHGFWRAEPRLDGHDGRCVDCPDVTIIMPARDEADVIERSIRSLLEQDYPGRLDLIVVDDQSSDGTGDIVRALAAEAVRPSRIKLLRTDDRPKGWTGKLWAIETAIDHVRMRGRDVPLLLLTDADIAHHPGNLSALIKKMVNEDRDMVSIMVRLRNHSVWERFLIPPFVFFFQMLYPFEAVNKPAKSTAAAAGGCVLIRRSALDSAGGIQALKGALIDDVTLAKRIKVRPGGDSRIWIGHGVKTISLRAYDDLASIWSMVARTADTQLRHSLMNLVGTTVGMALIYLIPPLLVLSWPIHLDIGAAGLGFGAWLLMVIAFAPTLLLYRQSLLWAPTLPLAAALYTAMTIDSARLHRQGKGGHWKGRTFSDEDMS